MTDNFDALFDNFASTAHRLEALPSYAVSHEDAAYSAFRHGTARPVRSVRTSPWMRRIALTSAAGRTWSRTRVIDKPLTDYQRFQLPAYLESQAVGEEIRLVQRADARDLLGRDLPPDVWLFDEDSAAVMRYSIAGEFEGFRPPADVDELRELATTARLLHEAAMPLPQYLARLCHAEVWMAPRG